MKDKTQDVKLLEELQKIANNIIDVFTELGETLAKILPDVEIPEEEEDTWEMKCPYEYGDKHYCIQSSGDVFLDYWRGIEADNSFFSQGNIFPTKQAALLEVKRRNLLTRFRAFRDECNDGLRVDWNVHRSEKWSIAYQSNELHPSLSTTINDFSTFGYFVIKRDAERAIELFGDEIKELFVECE